MEEDGFDDNGWSRFFAPNAQGKFEPPNAGRDLTQEHLKCGTEDIRAHGADCMLKTEDEGSEIDLRARKPDEQRKIGYEEGNNVSLNVGSCEKDEEIHQDQASFHDARGTQHTCKCEIHYCEITPLEIDETKHTVSATEWSPFDPSSLNEKEEDNHNTKKEENTVDDEANAAAESTLFESLPTEEDKDKSNTKEEKSAVGDPKKALFEGPPFQSLPLKCTGQDKDNIKQEKAIGDQAEAASESPHFESLSLKEKDTDNKRTKKSGKAPRRRTKAATNSSHVGFLMFEKTGSNIFRNPLQTLSKWISYTCLEKKENVKSKIRSCYRSLLSKWFEMKDEDKNNYREAGKAVVNSQKATTELCHVQAGSHPSKFYENKRCKKTQSASLSVSGPQFLSNPVKLLKLWFPLFLSMLISVLFQAAAGSLVIAPKDVISLKGKEIRLRCSTHYQNTVYWERILVGSNEQHTIYFGINGMVNIDNANGRIKIDSDPATGRYDLVIKDLQPMDAGTYSCVGDNGIGEVKRAQVIVLDDFSCDLSMPGNGFMGENTVNLPVDNIQASCSFQYRGHEPPRIQWRLDNIEVNTSHVNNVNNGSTVRSVVALRGTKELNGVQISSLPTVSSARNSDAAPWWTSTHLKVNYIHLELGEVQECQGDSAMVPMCAPSCEYQQVEIPDNDLCYCVAVYNMGGVKYNITFNKHLCHGSDSFANKSWVIIAACALIFGFIVVATVVCHLFIRGFAKRKQLPAEMSIRREDTVLVVTNVNGAENTRDLVETASEQLLGNAEDSQMVI